MKKEVGTVFNSAHFLEEHALKRIFMKIEHIIEYISKKYSGLVTHKNWGEKGLFYNPENRLKLGAYMLTFKEKDGIHDAASQVNRSSVQFRLNLKISRDSFTKLFGAVPARPPAGGIVATGHDFTQLDEIMPHPVYGWMTWICVLNPSDSTIEKMASLRLFDEAYAAAIDTFNKKAKRKLSCA
ncbi:MAG: hypothetical protein QG604_441 [Candidatus Dependentiae bacterium]|nr:hypothetical protein [Candidatus Dependentiae bacterium]